jgi:hypothetical protein
MVLINIGFTIYFVIQGPERIKQKCNEERKARMAARLERERLAKEAEEKR